MLARLVQVLSMSELLVANLETALYRDESKLQVYRSSNPTKSGIDIYSCSGSLIRRINVLLVQLTD